MVIIDSALQKVEELRTRFRNIHHRLKSSLQDDEYNTDHKPAYDLKIQLIKNYITSIKTVRRNITTQDDQSRKVASEVKLEKFTYLKKKCEN